MPPLAHPAAAQKKSEAAPRLPHGDRVLRVRRQRDCSLSRVGFARATLPTVAPLLGSSSCLHGTHASRLPSRRTGRTSNIDAQAWYALRCVAAHSRERHQDRWGASVARLSSRECDADWHRRGSRTPAFRPTSNDLSGRCNRGSRTLDTAVMSCLLYPTELHCSGGQGYVGRGYTRAAWLPRASVVGTTAAGAKR